MENFESIAPHLTRQFDIIPLDILTSRINIIGAGAVGSFTALTLAKMGFKDISVWDFDSVSIENMNSQFYRFKDIGCLKVTALKDLIKDFTDVEIETLALKYEPNCAILPGILIMAVDSMNARKTIWENHKEVSIGTRLIIDPRMGAEVALLETARPMNTKDIERYEKTLYSDDEAMEERCTAKATMYTATMLSGLICKTVVGFLKKESYPASVQWSIKDHDMLVTKVNLGLERLTAFANVLETARPMNATENIHLTDDYGVHIQENQRLFSRETARPMNESNFIPPLADRDEG